MKKNNLKVIKIVKNLINNFYVFMGYIEFSNLIAKKSNIDDIISVKQSLTDEEKKILIKNTCFQISYGIISRIMPKNTEKQETDLDLALLMKAA